MATLNWEGRQVRDRVAAATAVAVDRTMSLCVQGARREHPWKDRTGFEDQSIMVRGAASLEGTRVVGNWGAYTSYSLFLEIGTSRIGPTAWTREQSAGGNMWQVPAPRPQEGVSVRQSFTILPPGTMPNQADWVTLRGRPSVGEGPLMAPRPFLRPQADQHYRLLPLRIRQALNSQEMA